MRDEFVQCSAEHQRKPGDSILRCQLHAGHDGEHKWPGVYVDRTKLVDEIAEWVAQGQPATGLSDAIRARFNPRARTDSDTTAADKPELEPESTR